MLHRVLFGLLYLLLSLPVLGYDRIVEFRSVSGEPVAGAKIYYREFLGCLDLVNFGPTGMTEEVLTTDDQGRVRVSKAIPARMPSAFGSDYALVIAEGYTPQLLSLGDLQNRVYMRPFASHQLTLLLPDGTPAAGATVIVAAEGGRTHQLDNPFTGVTTPQFTVTADAQGIAQLPCIRRATAKDSDCGVLMTGVAFCNGHVNEAVSIQSVGPAKAVIALKPARQTRGTVTDVAGRPIAGAVVRCAEYPLPPAFTDAKGNFSFDHLPTTLAPQQYGSRIVDSPLTLYIDAEGYARQAIALLPAPANVDKYRIALEPLVTVTGKLVDADTGQPVTNSRKFGYYIRVRHALGTHAEGRMGNTILVTSLDGTFTAKIPRQACLEVTDSMAIRTPFTPGDYHDGDVVTLQAKSR